MTQHIRDRINRQLDALGEDRLYQVLDYVEFLESRYGQRAATPPNTFQRLADTIEDRLRAGGLAASTVSEAMGFLNKAVGALNGAVAAGRSVATDLASTAQRVGTVVVDAVNTPPGASTPGASTPGTVPPGAGAPGAPPPTTGVPAPTAPQPGAAAWPPPPPASPVSPAPAETPAGTGPATEPRRDDVGPGTAGPAT